MAPNLHFSSCWTQKPEHFPSIPSSPSVLSLSRGFLGSVVWWPFSGCRRPSPSHPGSCCGSCWPLCPQDPGSNAPSAWHVHADVSGSASEGGFGFPGPARHLRLPRRLVGRDAASGGGGCPHFLGRAQAPHRGRSQCPCRSHRPRCRPSPGCPGSPSRRCLAVKGLARCLLVAGHERSAGMLAAGAAAGASLPGLSDSHAACRSHHTLSEALPASAHHAPSTPPAASRTHATRKACRDTNSTPRCQQLISRVSRQGRKNKDAYLF